MTTVAFHTLGCKVNQYETEGIWQSFKEQGYDRVDFESIADVYVINTCTVTNTGDKKSRQVIRRAIRKNPEAVVCVTGCYAQVSPGEVMEIPGVDVVVGTQDRGKMIDFIEEHKETRVPVNGVSNIMKNRVFEEMDVPDFSDRTRANLKIQEGCNNFCTFCIIPWSRGLLRSRDPENVLKQAQQLVDAGYKEIVLTGIHTAGYGEDLSEYDFADLLSDLETKVKGLKRIRISSIEASQITEKVMQVIDQSEKIVRHLHVPLQAGSDNVLERMRRKYTTAFYKSQIDRLKQALPGLAVTSDVIVGFPGETEEEFMETYRFIQEVGFSELHVFPYSKRTGTPAAKMDNQVDDETKNKRVHQLMALSEQQAKEYASLYEGELIEVIPEEVEKTDAGEYVLTGYSDNYMRLSFKGEPAMIGEIVKVKLTKAGYPINEGEFVRVMSESHLSEV
ncbi:threonylcarbamoyladenosine tRNA methylthiotransferase MtaB [Halolactibacillus alkaliphilus]|uniref:Threonylcarbamoyladenosine tRNA methylthiotransferase MtaB n=1 Tax=Halolactibacillus alkaliphilus TaxID=442899 RepID=A0A511X3A8_9BACI|nr:tRNA (N(6)-L-threonylcarbamoyladenosine(37)-C(2))-methylthiotransferase MtaB [Halolactibacillus alkaliphilus]GEN57422.1 threonylcarbamoyladenosine tRNA methylthiotransferase MtaB [Halolactibacillus alkaliphilus]GGN69166.1 threonylcarbamoyladenosine tRNA methylthiotransferase MtaB [Halolactibacillus alkaliphilus]SFO73900.1 threonylcarbamoyladenosine tRNA methylthiotransferase MtaB [Halolactibacillus alkaliphilus]